MKRIAFCVGITILLLYSSRAILAEAPVVTVYVTLEGDSAMLQNLPAASSASFSAMAANARLRGTTIKAQQDALQPKLEALGAKTISHFSRLANAMKIRVPADKVALIQQLPGVRKVSPVHRYHRGTETSVPFIGAPLVWGQGQIIPHIDGSGIKIGIIDTGIDYFHADFGGSGNPVDYVNNDSTWIEPGTFPTAKVVGGYDFVGDQYNPDNPAHAVPAPDPDPLDLQGHGTHVAGIAAGFGVLTNGAAYTGAYTQNLDYTQFSIGPGVAPKALLYALKVFGTGATESIFDALEWAADPNGDFDFSDHLDVVNLSLGEDFGLPTSEDVELDMINQLSQLGCVVAVAAGNAGNTFYAVGSPAIATRSIAVASSVDDGIISGAIRAISPPEVVGSYLAVEAEFTKPLSVTGPIEGQVAYVAPSDACDELTNAAELKGKIALIDRGICFFVDKVQHAQDAGAIAVVMVNNEPGDPFIMGGDPGPYVIPGIMVSQHDGEILKASLGKSLILHLDASSGIARPELADTLSSFSSRGPSAAHVLKPELAAPGDTIRSARAGSGNQSVLLSGTSMATPTVAGAAALIKQLHPDWSVEDIKAVLMNTAVPTHDRTGNSYPESMTGAGRLAIDLAASAPLTAAADNGEGIVSLSFGDLQLTNATHITRNVRLKNHGASDLLCTISISNTISQTGFALTSGRSQIIVPSHGSALVDFHLAADPNLFHLVPDALTPPTIAGEDRHFLYEASGEIYVAFGAKPIHLPYYASLRAASSFHASAKSVEIKGGNDASPDVQISIPQHGFSTTASALASVFELGYESPPRNLTDLVRNAGDLLAVGAASDASSYDDYTDVSLYFGLATAGSWATPQPTYIRFNILIDLDRDGLADVILHNGPDPGIEDPPGTDVFYSVLDGGGFFQEITGYLNVFPAAAEPTALFDNSVVFLSVPAQYLGLTRDSSQIRYQVQTSTRLTASEEERLVIDTTPWINFDACQPILDATPGGIQATPLLADGHAIAARANLKAASDAGQPSPGLLILHHHNTVGNRLDIVRLDLSNADSDNDGLPDWWEKMQFGNLTTAGPATDQDKDGTSDLLEFKAGTDPLDASSNFRITASLDPDGNIALSWPSASGRTYVVEATSDLAQSFKLLAVLSAPTAPVQIFEPVAGTTDKIKFYRVSIQ